MALVEGAGGRVSLESPLVKLALHPISPGILSAVKLLADGGARERELGDVVLEHDGPSALPHLYLYLHQFHAHKIICRTVTLGGEPLATLVPTSFYYNYEAIHPDPQKKHALSRFACLRNDGGCLVAESPLGHARVVVHSQRAGSLLAHLVAPHSAAGLAELVPGVDAETAASFVDLLASAGVLAEDGARGASGKRRGKNRDGRGKDSDALRQWDFHDLLFHARSRVGRHANPYGGTYRFVGEIDPLPAVKPPMSEETIDLFKPNLDRLKKTDRPFTSVLEERKSKRAHSERPISARQLGEFLYRAARSRHVYKSERGELGSRPYPGGGAIYELEIYAVVNSCRGVAAGLYHYRPDAHQLSRLSGQTPQVERLLEYARHTSQQPRRPQVLFVVTARFGRVMWKYQSMAYALVLKDVGALYQTMYLVGEAMGLAACALGGGDSDLFAQAAGLDYYAESSVGEFILGSPQDSEARRARVGR